ncbi:MAG: DUF3943 domain-containing protein [Treponema sp.]|jgi:hypothetical protein|nr:DUF3943 domain-containing protein [Treponema sp.]
MCRDTKAFLYVFFSTFILATAVFPQATEPDETPVPSKRHWIAARWGGHFSNTLLYSFNRYVGKYDFAQVVWEDRREKLRDGWEWDHDAFATNQFAHPYQGSTYHAAARANGFGFYGSILFDAFGSMSWELFAETTPPSVNDLISTTLGGASLGEMFHRLYLEINSPWGVLVSPLDSLNGLVTRRRPEKQSGRNIQDLSVVSGFEWTAARRYDRTGSLGLKAWDAAAANLGCHIIYGAPFEQRSSRPYNHFELSFGGSFGSEAWYSMYIVSDGYLVSFSPVNSERKHISTGLTLNYDFFTDRNIDFFSEGLDWAVKYRRLLYNNTSVELKAHTGWTAFGAASLNFYDSYNRLEETYRDYGTGANAKIFLSLAHPRWGKVSLETLLYEMFIVSHDIPGSKGRDFYHLLGASYVYPLGDRMVLGVRSSAQGKRGDYDTLSGTRKWNRTVSVYAMFKPGPFGNQAGG